MPAIYAPDADLVFSRVPVPLPDDLVDIEFVDMTPLADSGEAVGVEPHAAVISIPGGEVDICGVGGLEALVRTPDTYLDWLGRIEPEREDPDLVRTEEFAPFDARPGIAYTPPE